MNTRAIAKRASAGTKLAEGLRLKAYFCPAGVRTIGYGHTGRGASFAAIDQDAAERYLEADLMVAADTVLRLVKVPLTVPQAAALADFVFNLGGTAFRDSTLLARLNAGDYAAVPAQLRRWTKARVKGVLTELPGLVKRREANINLWNSPQ